MFPAGTLEATDFYTTGGAQRGRLNSTAPTINPNTSIAHFTYDALGRLIAKQAPWPLVAGEIRTEIYLHDGVRRIQEIWRQPATGNGAEGGQNQNNGPPTYVDITEREYVHSPGYVDEFVCEISTDGPDTFWWVLQDPNYNVVALVSDGDGSLSRGEVARQYSWSPYGQLLRADIYDTSAPMSRLGHQGLFHDRLDADILSEPMVAFAQQAVQNRNRTLLPWLGRFAQRDPNGSAVGALDTPSTLGSALTAAGVALEVEAIFRDGQSLYAYVGSDPINGHDPLGLFFSFVGVQSANEFRSELAQQQFEVGVDVATALFSGILSGASLHSTMVEILSDTFGRDSRSVDDALMAFNEAVLDFRDARRLDTALRGHHIVAKFLGGDPDGMLVNLTDAEHNHIHRLIDKELDKRNLPKMREMSQSKWERYLSRGNRADRALDALRAGTTRFDRLYGTRLIAELDRALAQQVRAGGKALGVVGAAKRRGYR